MTYEKIIADIDRGDVKPVYFLYGDEAYFIDKISSHIESVVLDEDAKAFNLTVLYGKDTNVEEIMLIARRFPVMSDRQVLIVKEAQDLARSIDKMQAYLEEPTPSTVLVFNYKYKKPDKRKKVFKLFAQAGVFFESKKLYDSEISSWIENYVREAGYGIDAKSSAILAEYLGTDLSRIANEINKLKLVLPEKGTITPELIEKNIGVSKDYNNFELVNAIARNDVLKAHKIIRYFAAHYKKDYFFSLMNVLQGFFTKLLMYHALRDKTNKYAVAKTLGINPYFVPEYAGAAKLYPMRRISRIVSLLREYDMKAKGLGARDMSLDDLLKELIFKIMH